MKIKYGHGYVDDAMRAAVNRALDSEVYFQGTETDGFEREFAAAYGVKHAVTVNSGSSALFLILLGLGIGPGDEVLVPAAGFVTVGESVLNVGATPVFIDIEDETYAMDLGKVEEKIGPRAKAIIPVHTYGHPMDMDRVLELAARRGLVVIEDCAHANGARYSGRKVGTMGRCGFFSFAGKSMSVAGLGGMVITDDDDLAREVRLRRDHGRARNVGQDWYRMERIGHNLRLSELHAAIGRVQLTHLDEWNARRRENAAQYTRLLAESGVPLRAPVIRPWAEHAFLHYTIRARSLEERRGLVKHLEGKGVDLKVIYPMTIPQLPAFQERLGIPAGSLPVAEKVVDEILCLPVNPKITPENIGYVVEGIQSFYRGAR